MEEILQFLAEKYLNDIGQKSVTELVADGRFELAKIYICGALDRAWNDKTCSDDELRNAHKLLQLDEQFIHMIRSDFAINNN